MRIALVCLLAACGRLGFADRTVDAARGDGVLRDAAHDAALDSGATSSQITYIGPFAQRHPGAGSTDTFTAKAAAVGDVIVFQLGCGSSTMPAGVAISAAGWTFAVLHASEGVNPLWASRMVAIAPDRTADSFSVTWTGSPCDIGTSVLADEFAGVDTAGGVGMVSTAAGQASGVGTCTGQITTVTTSETIWAACFSSGSVSAVGPGFMAGAANGGGDAAEYRITNDPAGTLEQVNYANAGGYLMDMISLRTR